MVCRYRLRDKSSDSRFVEGILVSKDWTLSREELPLLEKWPSIVEIQKAEREEMFSMEEIVERLPPNPETMTVEELRSWAHSYGIQESEYTGLSREKLIELIEVAKEMET